MLIYSDENIEVIHRAGSSRYLLVTFNEMEMQANGSRFWAQRFCEKADIAALGFISRRPNWFPAASIVKAVDAAQPILRAAPERVLYGHSQGGYAALRYRRRFDATVAIAFCPQASIDPNAVPFDRRFTRHFSPKLHTNMGSPRPSGRPRLCLFRSVPFGRSPARGADRGAPSRDAARSGPYDRTWHRPCLHWNSAGSFAHRLLPSGQRHGPTGTCPRGSCRRTHEALPNRGLGNRSPSRLRRPVAGSLWRGFLARGAREFPVSSGQPSYPRQ